MRFIGKSLMASVSAVLAFATAGSAQASSHREAPAISKDPAVDNTDTYAWKCGDSLCIAANYDGLQLPEGGPNYSTFSTAALYSMHITHNDSKGVPNLDDFITIDVDFQTGPKHYTKNRVRVDDKAKGPGGGKEFFAQLGSAFDLTANVTLTKKGQRARRIFNKVPVAPPNIGQRTATFVYGNPDYAKFAEGFVKENGGYKFFAGPRDDAFYVNLAQTFDLGAFVGLNKLNGAPFRSRAYDLNPADTDTFATTDKTKAPDGVAGTNVNSIVIQIPLSDITDDGRTPAAGTPPSNKTLFGVWASASRPAAQKIIPLYRGNGIIVGATTNQYVALADDGKEYAGAFTQVSRLGLPLINEAVIGIQDKDWFNRSSPKNDVNNFGAYFLNPVIVRDVEAIGGYAQLGVPTVPDDFKYGRVDILNVINLDNIPSPGAHSVPIKNGNTGDVLRVDVAVPSGFPNGRPLSGGNIATTGKEEDVTDIELLLLLAKLNPAFAGKITDYVDGPGDGRRLLPVFPYLGVPFAGDSEGKGSPSKL